MVPFCYFFDIDGTIIGDISSQVYEWDLITTFEPNKLQAFKRNVCSQLVAGLLRPGFSTFLDFLKARHSVDGCEFFIYTASETKWANFIVSCIENVIGFKFNRPLFTRPQCVSDGSGAHKSFMKVLPVVIKKFGIKSDSDIRGRFILVDNNRVLPKDEETRLILCPTYLYTDITDVIRLLSEQVLQKNIVEIADFLHVRGLLNHIDSISLGANSVQVVKAKYYSTMAKRIKENLRDEGMWVRDQFWVRLGNIMHTISLTTLGDSYIHTINRELK